MSDIDAVVIEILECLPSKVGHTLSQEVQIKEILVRFSARLATAEAARATWQQRATSAEASRDTWRAAAEENGERLSKATRLWGEWARRATGAEAERDRLRGEVAQLREAVQAGKDQFKLLSDWFIELGCKTTDEVFKSLGWGLGDTSTQMLFINDALAQFDATLLATPRAAQLGTLVEAALAETLIEDEMTNLGPFEDGTKAFQNRLAACKTTRRLAARAVLASEVRT